MISKETSLRDPFRMNPNILACRARVSSSGSDIRLEPKVWWA